LLNALAWIACIIFAGLLLHDLIKVEMNNKTGQGGE
jgi:hypothetical protein